MDAKRALDHAECIERELSDWKKIFSLTEKAYGYRINSYKGKQKLIYIPDMIDGKKVAYIHDNAFPRDCAVICNKRLFDKFDPWLYVIQVNSACVYMKTPEVYPDEFSPVVRSYVLKNKDIVSKKLFEEDDVGAFDRFIALTMKRFDREKLEEYLADRNLRVGIKSYLMDRLETKAGLGGTIGSIEKDDFGVAIMKKLWSFIKKEDGTVFITSFKGRAKKVFVPDRIGKDAVTAIGDQAFSTMKPRATPEQQRSATLIETVVIPEGIVTLGKEVFYGNLQLENVVLPRSLKSIGPDSFNTYRGPQSITIHAPAGSYAEQYAKEHNIPFEAE